jgi:MFS family permease
MNVIRIKNLFFLLLVVSLVSFAFFGANSLLIIQLKDFAITMDELSKYSKFYTVINVLSLVLPLVIWIISDKYLTQKQALKYSILVLMLGLILNLISSLNNMYSLWSIGSNLLVIGFAIFLCISYTSLSNLYGTSPLRDCIFTLMFLAIGLVSFLADKVFILSTSSYAYLESIFLIMASFVFIGNLTNIETKDFGLKSNYKSISFIILLSLIALYLSYQFRLTNLKDLESMFPIIPSIQSNPSITIFYVTFAIIWFLLSEFKIEIDSLYKILFGIFLISIFLIFNIDQKSMLGHNMLNIVEVIIIPISLSLITKIAPMKCRNTFLGLFFTIIILKFFFKISLIIIGLVLIAYLILLLFRKKPCS